MYKAKVADILRLNQRDEAFVNEVEEKFHVFLRSVGPGNYHRIRKLIPVLANAWYYIMTSAGNFQTLGEEYTGTVRIDAKSKLPSKLTQTLWLILYVGGEPIIDRLLNNIKSKVSKSTTLTTEAKSFLLNCTQFVKEQKVMFKRIHQSIFYMNAKYYNISNRFTGIKYALVRQWFQDDTFTGSFKILGHFSLFYILFAFVQQITSSHKNNTNIVTNENVSKKECVLCAENLKNACCTPCGHIFCWECIYDSLKYQKNCPVCREAVGPSRIIFLQNYI